MKIKELFNIINDVQDKIGSSKVFICGGTPRDKYLNALQKLSDIDLTTGDNSIQYLSQELYSVLKNKYRITYKTMDDNHSTIFIGNIKLDFSSNFIVPNIEKYIPNIKNPTSMQKELFSRDFTCNSLLLTLDLKSIIDPTKNGIKDINNKIIKTCLTPEVTLLSNRNRVIRSIYLACKLGFEIDKSIIDYVSNNPESVKNSTHTSLSSKLQEAFKWNPNKASSYISKMNLWDYLPITKEMYKYYKKEI